MTAPTHEAHFHGCCTNLSPVHFFRFISFWCELRTLVHTFKYSFLPSALLPLWIHGDLAVGFCWCLILLEIQAGVTLNSDEFVQSVTNPWTSGLLVSLPIKMSTCLKIKLCLWPIWLWVLLDPCTLRQTYNDSYSKCYTAPTCHQGLCILSISLLLIKWRSCYKSLDILTCWARYFEGSIFKIPGHPTMSLPLVIVYTLEILLGFPFTV